MSIEIVKGLIKKCVNQNTINQNLDKDNLKNINNERSKKEENA